jgi:mediator of RNA polymerase II transcription subunit 14
VDYVPPDIRIDRIADGRAYVTGGKGQWHAELSLTGFGTGMQGRWWLTGIEWGWRAAGEAGKENKGKRFKGNERQQILDLANREVLPPEEPEQDSKTGVIGVGGKNTGRAIAGSTDQPDRKTPESVDAPLVRLVNFIRESIGSSVSLLS